MIMNLLDNLKMLNLKEYSIALASTTAKQGNENRLLPFHRILGGDALNMMIHDSDIAREVFAYLDQYIEFFFVDVERKKNIPLWSIAKSTLKNAIPLPYKPNDLTREATYNLLCHYYNYELDDKKILIFGSGNIATKLALYLAEHEAQVSLHGRNEHKITLIKDSLNSILPAFSNHPIAVFSEKTSYDVFITALSTEQVIDASFVRNLAPNALVIDVGIGNLTPAFIKKAQKKSVRVIRLDARAGTPILETMIEIYKKPFPTSFGHILLYGLQCVSGGTIGEYGDLVLDDVSNPRKVLGIANGIGGIKKHNEYTPTDFNSIEKISAFL